MKIFGKDTTFFFCATRLHTNVAFLQPKQAKGYEQKQHEHEKTTAFYQGGEPQNGQGRF